MTTGHLEQTSLQTLADPPLSQALVRTDMLFGLLREAYATLERALQAVRASDAPDPSDWNEFVALVSLHCRVEEDTLYRLMSQMPQTMDAAVEAVEEHDQLEALVEMSHAPPSMGSSERDALLSRLQADLLKHHANEEQTMIPLVAETFDADELERLSERFLRCRERHLALARGEGSPAGPLDTWPPDALYELAQARRIRGRNRMGRAELLAALCGSG